MKQNHLDNVFFVPLCWISKYLHGVNSLSILSFFPFVKTPHSILNRSEKSYWMMMNRVDICILCALCQNVEEGKSTELKKKKNSLRDRKAQGGFSATLCRHSITLLKLYLKRFVDLSIYHRLDYLVVKSSWTILERNGNQNKNLD